MKCLSTRITAMAAVALASIAPAGAAGGAPELHSARRIAARFASLAGSEDNALALALALRSGTPVRLCDDSLDFARIEPPPRAMAWRTVDESLAAARDALLRLGVARPTIEQLRAVLTGGELTDPEGRPIVLPGVLEAGGAAPPRRDEEL